MLESLLRPTPVSFGCDIFLGGGGDDKVFDFQVYLLSLWTCFRKNKFHLWFTESVEHLALSLSDTSKQEWYRKDWSVGRGIVVLSPPDSYCHTLDRIPIHTLEGPRNGCIVTPFLEVLCIYIYVYIYISLYSTQMPAADWCINLIYSSQC